MTDEVPFHICTALDAPERPEAEVTRVKGRAALVTGKHWGTHRRLSVGFFGGAVALRERVAGIADAWYTATDGGIDFQFWTAADVPADEADIRISFVQDGRSWSYIGTDAKNIPRDQPTMNLGWMTEDLEEEKARAVVLHEFGHALGLIHEHQNPHQPVAWDIDAVVRDLRGPPNNWDNDTIRQNMFKAYDPDTVFATDTDSQSIMMYPIPGHWTTDDFSVGFNSDLSPDDIRLIKAAYPKFGH
jgi:hypothetical protein